ncbi:MAG: DUF1289 domain-containing protein [Gammaproteobacteria bacterium]|nr:DUF1289 domain-containing protein [Gammaproteobacteria bacterium]
MRADSGAATVRSPCVSICALGDDDICIGCHRSAREIADWVLLGDEERRAVLARAAVRARRNNPFAS